MGTVADGVFGDYHYRHPEYKLYCRQVSDTSPGLQGGLRRSELESRVFPLEVALLSSRVSPALFWDVLGDKRGRRLLHRWQGEALVVQDSGSEAGDLCLTANGSWFVADMMAELVG